VTVDAHKIVVKFFADGGFDLSGEQFVPVLHTWIQQHAMPDHTLIDVADYSHVHQGPGTLVVGHEANFYLDRTDGFLGLSYSRKQPFAGNFGERLRQAFTAALRACARLEDEPALHGKLKFRTNEALVRLNDRLLAPNTPQTYQHVKPQLEELAAALWPGAAVEIEHNPAELSLFEVRMTATESPDIAMLLNRLEAASPAPSR
jgi:hypothetical protein